MDKVDKGSKSYVKWREIQSLTPPARQKVSGFAEALGMGNDPEAIVKTNERLLVLKSRLEDLSELTFEQQVALKWLKEQYANPGDGHPAVVQIGIPESDKIDSG